jgi:hypothetical protein
VVPCAYRKPETLSIARESVDNHGDGRSPQVDRTPWPGCSGRAQPCKPKFSPFGISSMCSGVGAQAGVSNIDRVVFAGLYHLAPEVLDAVKILKPETIIRSHRAGFEPGGAAEACGWDEPPRLDPTGMS